MTDRIADDIKLIDTTLHILLLTAASEPKFFRLGRTIEEKLRPIKIICISKETTYQFIINFIT